MQQEHKHDEIRRQVEVHGDKDGDDWGPGGITIIVNGREKSIEKMEELTFDQLVSLAFDDPPTGKFVCFTITYRRGHRDKPEGHLAEGETVKVRDGMIFDVTPTNKS